MKIVGALLISAVMVASIRALFYLTDLQSAAPSPGESGATAVETRVDIPEQHPSGNDLRQNDWGGPNHSICIDNAIKKTLQEPDSFRFISATLWRHDVASYGSKAWICQATYRVKNGFDGSRLLEKASIIFDAGGCRVVRPPLEMKSAAMTASERKTLEYAIKTIHDHFSNAQ